MVTDVRVVFCSVLLTGQDVQDGMVVGKVRLVGAVHLVDQFDSQCGKVGQVVGMLASSSQDDILAEMEIVS